ncbi:MAG TPA: M20/M25/M40 family metallo-hydrolase [Anaerolineales bacterium]|nr:M20/M25/M40 family metallo-hydrolase [Anaerolineales bacterium]
MPLNDVPLEVQAGSYADDLVAFLQDLVRIPSVNGRDPERPAAERVAAEAEKLGFDAALHASNPDRPNVLVSWGYGPRGFALIGHLDTVAEGDQPWRTAPFDAVLADGKMYGRGTADNKAGIACGLYTLALLRDAGTLDPAEHRVLLAGVADEESGASSPDGVRFLLDSGLLPVEGAIYTYAGDIVCIGHRGLLRLWIEARGRSVHSGSDAWSRGEAGVNAVTGLAQALLALEGMKRPAPEGAHFADLGLTVTPGTLVEGGEFESMVPSRARAAVDIRLPPGTNGREILAEIESRLEKVRADRPGLALGYSIKNDLPAAMIDPDHPLARLAQKHAEALFGREYPVRIAGPANEGYMLIGAGIPTLPGFGPLGGNAHAPDEWVDLASLLVTVAVYASVIRDYLNLRK